MLEYGLRFLAGGIAVSAFAALGDSLRPKSLAGLFGAGPSIALATLLITLSHKGSPFAATEARSMVVGGLSACRLQLGSVRLAQKIPAVLMDRDDGSSGCLVRNCAWCIRGPVSTLMIVQFKPSALRQTRWYEYLVRFVLGGAMTVVAGLIAARFGPVVGGLFLAFPAIFPASATLIEKHVRERKEKAGLPGARRGKEAAALDAAGAALGSLGLAAFGLVIWLMIVQSPAWALVLAAASWLAVAVLAWQVRRWL
jgi:hypothetical protein